MSRFYAVRALREAYVLACETESKGAPTHLPLFYVRTLPTNPLAFVRLSKRCGRTFYERFMNVEIDTVISGSQN